MEFSSLAIVLGKRDIGETDRLYSLLTRDGGKVRAVARGVRKSSSKLAGQLETLNLVDISIMRNRGRGNIAGAITELSFSSVRSGFSSLQAAVRVASIIDGLTRDDDPDIELFRLLLEYLKALDIVSVPLPNDEGGDLRQQEKIFLLSDGFLWKSLEQLGYRVESHVCATGGEPLLSGEKFWFSPDAGGVVCATHQKGSRAAIPFSENSIKMLRMFLSVPNPLLAKLSLPAHVKRELQYSLKSFLDWRG